jgi:hypothetical protein
LAGGVNIFKHIRKPVDMDKQTTIAMNRDTLYSLAVLDLAKPVIITLPRTENRYMSMQIIDEAHYSPFVFDKPGTYKLTQNSVGSRYAFVVIRTLVDPNNPEDMKTVHALQNAINLEGDKADPFNMPNYDMDRYQTLYSNIQKLMGFWNGDTRGAMGKKGEVNELLHTVVTIAGWGLLPPKKAMYAVVNQGLNPDKKYKIDVPATVPVKAFWSIAIYNDKGYFVENELNAYSLNNITIKNKNADDSITIHLGGCDDGRSNCLPIPRQGFYYIWRMYNPETPIMEGKWRFPDPVELK